MASLQWQDASKTPPPRKNRPASDVTDAPTSASAGRPSNPWRTLSFFLIGLIAGFGAGQMRTGAFPIALQPSQVAQAPAAPAPPPPTPAPPPAPSVKDVPAVEKDTEHIRGNPDAALSVIEYSDFECPFCKRHHPTMAQLLKDYGDKVNWVYRHFPLSFHPNAMPTAVASECVHELGGNDAFWKFTDKVFETQGEWAYDTYVQELGLDVQKFQDCVKSDKFAQHIQDDMNGGSAAGVNGTPGNIILNTKTGEARIVSGAQPIGAFKAAIDAMLGADIADAKEPSNLAADAAAPSGAGRVIRVTAENWKFSPNAITAKKGEKVTLEIAGVSGVHSLAVPDLGINEAVQPGQVVRVTLPTDKTGAFPFRCALPCGEGHKDMTGQIVIE